MDDLRDTARRHGARSGRLARAAATALIAGAVLALALASVPAAAVSYGTPPPAAPATASAMATAPASASATASAAASPAASMTVPASLALGSHAASVGTVLAGPNGLTLYTLSSDPNGGSICTGQCLTFWPPLVVAPGGTVSGPSGAGTFATFARSDDGLTQVTLDGRALYYFKNDSQPGDANGEGIQALGGVWHAVKLASSTSSGGVGAATASPHVTIPPTSTASDAPTPAGDAAVPLVLLFLVSLAAGSLRFASSRARR